MMSEESARTYTVTQLGPPDERRRQVNIAVTDLQSLVGHHPDANRNARMVNGLIEHAENPNSRSYAITGGKIEEMETPRTDEYRSLSGDQALLIKDFILEDRTLIRGARRVDVPSPLAGVVSRRDDPNGLVEVSEHGRGTVLARVRHLSDIAVNVGDHVRYGQSLGIQNNIGLGLPAGRAIHVHMEVDSRRHGDFENYIADLVSGRLPVQSKFRENVEARTDAPGVIFRLGESHPRIRDLQRVMDNEGYRAAGGGPLDQDGVYRLRMQGALLDFQHDHGVRQTGDIDPATLQFAPRARGRVPDLPDNFQPGLPMPRMADPVTAPGHPDHVDHRPGLPAQPEPRINRRDDPSATLSPLLLPLAEALRRGDERSLSDACADIAGSNRLQELLREPREQARLTDAPHLSEHGRREDAPLLAHA